MKERLLAELDERIARHAGGDSSGVLDDQALAIAGELTELGAPDAGGLVRVAALHLCRYEALPPEHGEADLYLARAVYTALHRVDPRLVPSRVRDFLGLASPHDSGVELIREYERGGRPEHLERAISLFRQEVVEEHTDRADSLFRLGTALLRRFDRTAAPADLREAVELCRGALAAVERHDPRRARFLSGLSEALHRRSGQTSPPEPVPGAREQPYPPPARPV